MGTSFDTIAALFDGSNFTFDEAIGAPKGKPGAREWHFHQEGVERDALEDAESFAAYLTEDDELDVEVFHSSVVEGGQDGRSDEYAHVVGHLDSDPSKCWAVQIKATVPHVVDFDTSVDFVLLESPQKIKQLTSDKDKEETIAVARSIISSINGYSNGNNQKMLALFKAISEQPGGEFMAVLQSHFSGAALDTSAPKATGKRRASRM